jgi:anaphase-promoting complex subunit 2
MAIVERSIPTRDHNIFASVFPASAVRSPNRKRIFSSRRTANLDELKATLYDTSKQALGVGGEGFRYGVVTRSMNSIGFYTFFRKHLDSTHGDLSPINGERAFLNHLSKLPVWKQLPSLKVIFGTVTVEKTLATVVDELISEFINWSYANEYSDSVLSHLNFWIEHILCCYISHFQDQLYHRRVAHAITQEESIIEKWCNVAMTRIADLRISELFDIVVAWDATKPAVDDLKQYTTNPAARSYLTSEFATVLSQRLLHPGASTIRSFRRLDPRGVLLERVARKLRRYLRDRDDTIRVVVAGLLSDVSDEANQQNPDTLSELALELQQREHGENRNSDGELDWNNMDWMPDPIDAAPDYMKSKNTDVIGSLISLFESKDIFVRELQTMLADRLLKNRTDFDQEIGVVEHLKIRFGDTALQGCEVMLRDVLDSRKVDQVIRQDQNMNETTTDAQLHTKILSRLFWPSLQEQIFKVPPQIQKQQESYERGFESLKQTRKLTWLNAIGQVEVELELEDRTFNEEVSPAQASVIYAFQEEETAPTTKSITTLSQTLEMPATLVRSACLFWSSKQILTESSPGTFTVLETLPLASSSSQNGGPNASHSNINNNAAAQAAAAEAAAAQAAKQAEEAERKAKMAMYNQFIISMLTNGGAMPLPRIAMMLGIVVPGGFPFGNEELREFLAGMVKEGSLEMGAGGAYKAVT